MLNRGRRKSRIQLLVFPAHGINVRRGDEESIRRVSTHESKMYACFFVVDGVSSGVQLRVQSTVVRVVHVRYLEENNLHSKVPRTKDWGDMVYCSPFNDAILSCRLLTRSG